LKGHPPGGESRGKDRLLRGGKDSPEGGLVPKALCFWGDGCGRGGGFSFRKGGGRG